MSWQQVLSLVNADNFTAANNALQTIYGDDPGSNELGSLNASSDGQAPATVNICEAGLSTSPGSSNSDASKSMLQDWVDTLAGMSGCQSHVYGPNDIHDGWTDAGTFWGAFKVS